MRLNASTRRRQSETGFTLAEVVVASGIIGISCTSLAVAVSVGFSTAQASREDLRATQIMVQKMETLRLYNWTELQASNYVGPTFSAYYNPAKSDGVLYVGKVSVSAPTNVSPSYSNQLFDVTVSVSWTNYVRGEPIAHNRQMESFAGLYGIQNYVSGTE